MSNNTQNYDTREIKHFVRTRVKKSASSFYWGMRLTSPQKRNAIYSVYTFCREVDDITDGNGPNSEKYEKLNFWREEIENTYLAKPKTLIGQSLLPAIKNHNLIKQGFLDILDGMEMDVIPNSQIPDLTILALYCDRVACSVGRLSNSIFDLDRKTGNELAKSLGEALQLTNILRDIKEDYKRGKIYLPKSLLIEQGMSSSNISLDSYHPAIGKSCEVIAEIALKGFKKSEKILEQYETKQILPARIMMFLYRRLFEKLVNRGWLDLESEVRLSKWEKMYIVAKSAYFN